MTISYLKRPEGRLAYIVEGDGPLVIAVPGMGDLAAHAYRTLVPPLRAAGYRVALLELRGHGDSDRTFTELGDEATASDVLALIETLGGPAVVVGNSLAGSAALIAAAEKPDAVIGTVLLSPFVREPASPAARAANRAMYRVLFARPWGAAVWTRYYRDTLNRGAKPMALVEHLAAIRAWMRSGGTRELRRLAVAIDHSCVEQYLPRIAVESLVVIGALDPDYADASVELDHIASVVPSRTLLVDDAAHYPHLQRPDLVVPAILDYLATVPVWSARA